MLDVFTYQEQNRALFIKGQISHFLRLIRGVYLNESDPKVTLLHSPVPNAVM